LKFSYSLIIFLVSCPSLLIMCQNLCYVEESQHKHKHKHKHISIQNRLKLSNTQSRQKYAWIWESQVQLTHTDMHETLYTIKLLTQAMLKYKLGLLVLYKPWV